MSNPMGHAIAQNTTAETGERPKPKRRQRLLKDDYIAENARLKIDLHNTEVKIGELKALSVCAQSEIGHMKRNFRNLALALGLLGLVVGFALYPIIFK